MIWRALAFLTAVAAFSMAAPAVASSAHDVNEGVSRYRAGDDAAAWRLLTAAAQDGAVKASRYLGYMALEGRAPEGSHVDLFDGVALLKEAARAGDYAALIRLEDLRLRRLAHSPSLEDMIDIEIARAEAGDPVAAWRLAERYESGDGVAASPQSMARWLAVAASAERDSFPRAAEAAYRLCELNALDPALRDPQAARQWCAQAVDQGHVGARIILQRLAQL